MEHDRTEPRAKTLVIFGICFVLNRRDHRPGRAPRGVMNGVFRRSHGGVAPGSRRRLGESLVATWTVAGGLIALVYSIGGVTDAVRSAPWLMGPGLWVVTALGAGTLLRRRPGRDYPPRALVVATLAGGAADALVVSTGHPWPGLVTGVGVFSVAMALLGGSGARRRQCTARFPGTPEGSRG